MKIHTARVNFITEDIPVTEFENAGWQQADRVMIETSWNGKPAPEKRRTEVRLLWSESALYVRFDAEQNEELVVNDNPQTMTKTPQLWERDVCELFLAPDARNRRRYFEFEIAPTGEWLDLIVDWMKDEPRDWEYASAMETSAAIEPDKVAMVMKIPWPAFGKKPEAGDVWLGNMFRQAGSGETRGYLAWSPTMTATPQFHVPEKFGEFVFIK
ncbi:MAG: carbohydrate-binding family 9-like protein [Acidobacteriota bacterium]